MGYILPIAHLQTMQYIGRSELAKPEPIKLFPVHKLRVQPLKNENPPYVKLSIKKEKYSFNRVKDKEILAEVTGKGHYINKFI